MINHTETQMCLRVFFLIFLSIHVFTPAGAQELSGRASISVIVNDEIYPYTEFAVYVLPAEHLDICILAAELQQFRIATNSGALDPVSGCRWIWTAPDETGLYQITIFQGAETAMSLNVFVMVPASQVVNERIGDVEIGTYPAPLEDSPLYLPPDGFVRVTEDILGAGLSPHFSLGQFVTLLDGEFPNYVVLRERLLLKLEALLSELNRRGIAAESLGIIYAYMTPAFNSSIGGDTYKRQIYGGGATLIVDINNDGVMDDLDGNGVLNRDDGEYLFAIIDELFSLPGKEYLRGGLHLYDREDNLGTAIGLDARGFRKRWNNDSEVPPLPDELRAKHKRLFSILP